MLEKFPFDVGNTWETDLESFMSSTWGTFAFTDNENFHGSVNQLSYYADVLRGVVVCKDAADDWSVLLDNLFKVGDRDGVVGFANFGKNHNYESHALHCIDKYITTYVNELFKFVCGSEIKIESFFEDYEELVNLTQSHANVRFVVNLLNDFVRQFIEINKNETTRLDVGLIPTEQDKLCLTYRVRTSFTKLSLSLLKNILNSEDIVVKNDAGSIYMELSKGNKTYDIVASNIKDSFNNRVLRLYVDNPNSSQGVSRITVYKTMSDDFKFRLL